MFIFAIGVIVCCGAHKWYSFWPYQWQSRIDMIWYIQRRPFQIKTQEYTRTNSPSLRLQTSRQHYKWKLYVICVCVCVCERVKLIRNATVADERSIHTLRKYNKGNANEVCVNGVALDYRYMRQIYSVPAKPSPKIIFAHNMIKYITHLTLNLCMRSLRWRTFGHRKKRWKKKKEKRQTATKNNWTKAS